MSNVAILVGNSDYSTLSTLSCCTEDVSAMKELLAATEKFGAIEELINADAARLKERIRSAVDAHPPLGEIFFYFSGHGFQHDGEFFFCATNFDPKRPNETGLSNSELHTLLRTAEADLVVKVIDACNSGSLLIKSDGSFLPIPKHSFKSLIQIASCLESQISLTGHPLSMFTERFRAAAVRKTEGTVFYTDLIDALRDEFINNDSQTPHFVSQSTGREQFVENASRLDSLRVVIQNSIRIEQESRGTEIVSSVPVPTQLSILQEAQARFANRELVQEFIAKLFGSIVNKLTTEDNFPDMFSSDFIEHADYIEPTSQAFIIRVLRGEKRPDNFVTVTGTDANRRRNILELAAMSTWMAEPDNDENIVKKHTLRLNCTVEKVQLSITMTPKFNLLKRFVLVVSCVPSLHNCYVMEMLTQHSLRDWNVFDSSGTEVVRRWYKFHWTESTDGIVRKIGDSFKAAIQENIDSAIKAPVEK